MGAAVGASGSDLAKSVALPLLRISRLTLRRILSLRPTVDLCAACWRKKAGNRPLPGADRLRPVFTLFLKFHPEVF